MPITPEGSLLPPALPRSSPPRLPSLHVTSSRTSLNRSHAVLVLRLSLSRSATPLRPLLAGGVRVAPSFFSAEWCSVVWGEHGLINRFLSMDTQAVSRFSPLRTKPVYVFIDVQFLFELILSLSPPRPPHPSKTSLFCSWHLGHTFSKK